MIVCEKCGIMMKCVKNGVKVKIGYYSGYFRADLYECPSCGYKIITGFSKENFGKAKIDYDFSEK